MQYIEKTQPHLLLLHGRLHHRIAPESGHVRRFGDERVLVAVLTHVATHQLLGLLRDRLEACRRRGVGERSRHGEHRVLPEARLGRVRMRFAVPGHVAARAVERVAEGNVAAAQRVRVGQHAAGDRDNVVTAMVLANVLLLLRAAALLIRCLAFRLACRLFSTLLV